MDWLGPINPPCSVTGFRYVLLIVDYFSRFIWARGFKDHIAEETRDMWEWTIALIFGFYKGLYLDNGPHFVNQTIANMCRTYGISYFIGPISHLSSTGLLERAV